jgi:hypothetical protein
MPYGEDSSVLIGLRGICFMAVCLMNLMGMHLMGMHLTGRTAQKVGTNDLDNRRVEHGKSVVQLIGATSGSFGRRFMLPSHPR